jgi:hypothetical protein
LVAYYTELAAIPLIRPCLAAAAAGQVKSGHGHR